LQYHPDILVLTNIEEEHMDYFKNFQHIKEIFSKYVKQVKNSIVANKDDKNTLKILISNFKFLISKQTSIFQQPISNFIYFGLISCLIVIFVSDLKYHLISDYILLSLFVFSALSHLQQISQFPNFLISGFILALPIWLIYFFSKERSMGLGDVYLSAIMGFLLGWKTGFMALYIAFVTGAIFGLILIVLKRKKLKSRIPFGPFLVIGTVVMLFWGEKILKIIQRIYGF